MIVPMRMKSGYLASSRQSRRPCGVLNEDIAALNLLDRMLEAGISQWD